MKLIRRGKVECFQIVKLSIPKKEKKDKDYEKGRSTGSSTVHSSEELAGCPPPSHWDGVAVWLRDVQDLIRSVDDTRDW